jgi:hypothetical protein
MSDQDNNSGTGNLTPVSEETIRRCLLGAALPGEQSNFEERLLVDDEFEKRVRLAELELTDDFSFERLDAGDRELFAKNFLVTEERGRKVAVSKALRRSLATAADRSPVTSRISPPRKLWPRFKSPALFLSNYPMARVAIASLALLLLGVFIWLVWKSPRVQRPELVKRQVAPSPGRESHHPPSTQTPATPTTSPSSITPLAILVLHFGGQIEDQQIQFATAPSEADIVRFELVLASHQTATYQAELLSAAGDRIAGMADVKPVVEIEHAKVVWDVPAQHLRPGDYQIELSRVVDGQTQTAGRYSFRVKW